MPPSEPHQAPERLLFEQSHPFPRWIFVLLAVSTVTPCAIIGAMAFAGRIPVQTAALVLGFIFALDGALAVLLWSLRCRLAVTDAAIYIAVRPFVNVRLAHAAVAEARIGSAPALAGANWAPRRGWVINHGASRALHVQTRDGRRYLIGTDRPDELLHALRELGLGE